jgi:hypothetical protein
MENPRGKREAEEMSPSSKRGEKHHVNLGRLLERWFLAVVGHDDVVPAMSHQPFQTLNPILGAAA